MLEMCLKNECESSTLSFVERLNFLSHLNISMDWKSKQYSETNKSVAGCIRGFSKAYER